MSIVQYDKDSQTAQTIPFNRKKKNGKLDPNGEITDSLSTYMPSDEERFQRQQIIKHFTEASVTMKKPRREWNDMSTQDRGTIDEMAFNTYQPNDGDALEGDITNAWKSRAVRPVIRNKVISIAAHATARQLFPKLFAFTPDSELDEDAATVMSDLLEWTSEQPGATDYAMISLQAVITALHQPAAIVYHEYCEVFRTIKREKEGGKWKKDKILDDDNSGFQNEIVNTNQFFIENFYEKDLQKQGWVIWRRVQGYDLVKQKFGGYDNFQYVKPGVQVLYNDANEAFYEVYDQNMRQNEAEVVMYWNKAEDLFHIVVNGVLLTESDNPNPRLDKLYPFEKFGYHPIGNGNCFYYKSLAFELGPDEKIINTLYPMIIDGTYLSIMPPMINVGGEEIASDVIIPGMVTTLSDSNATLNPIRVSQDIKQGMDTLFKIEEMVTSDSQGPGVQAGDESPGTQTAYEISKIEQNSATVLGLFIKMIGSHVKQFTRLRTGDIIQYLTIADVLQIEQDPMMVYKVFMMPEKHAAGRSKPRKISFENPSNMPNEPLSQDDLLDHSFDVLHQSGGTKGAQELFKVNPAIFRQLRFMSVASPDVLNPMSEELERAFGLEEYDRMIANPTFDPQETAKLLLEQYPRTRKHPEKFIAKAPVQPQPGMAPDQPISPVQPPAPVQ